MRADTFDGLPAFLAVGRLKSFTRAGTELGVTPTAVSQTIKTLERRLGVVLFQRTTRSVAFTEAGAAMFERLAPAAAEVEDALTRERPLGTLRITAPRLAASLLVPLVGELQRLHPALIVEVSLDDRFVSLVEEGFDVGVRYGNSVEKDMIRVPLTKESRWAIVGAPSYFAKHGRPRTPEELMQHRAIGIRLGANGPIYRWELTKKEREVTVAVESAIIVNDFAIQLELARAGQGLCYTAEELIGADIAEKRLERVLTSYLTKGPGLYFYFPTRMQTQPKLRALIEIVTAKRK